MTMPARHSKAEPEAAAEQRDPPGKTQSQIDAEAPMDDEAAAAWQAEYESRVPAAMYETAAAPAEEPAEEEATGNPRDWKPRGDD